MNAVAGASLLGARPTAAQRSSKNSRTRVADIQRTRLLLAMVDVSVEHGARGATVAHVVRRSGVSRRTFYEIFENVEDCFLAAFEESVARVSRCVSSAYEPRAKWAERIRNALIALLEFLDAEPRVSRFVIVESLGAGTKALERRQEVLDRVIAAIGEGDREARAGATPIALAAEGVVGGVLSVLHSRLLKPHDGSWLGLTGALMSMIVLPYMGPAAGRRELERPVPAPKSASPRGTTEPLRRYGLRLTYRTMCVLTVVATTPGASNQRIASAAGIVDQGQMSKLLARLERLGLVENSGAGRAHGAPNAWMLTSEGLEVERTLNADAVGVTGQ